ncbi:MAG: DUF2283 domain-containing protein [Candidatus Aenigmarchaeota archaeon]|nr:DUF2283 domain-containing protein [Candidatus Aenigmarchaeota archaeon]
MQKYNFSYDKEQDDLFLYNPRSKSKGSVEMGKLILDFDSKKNLVGIQLMNAVQLLENLAGITKDTIKKLLTDLKECKVDIKTKNNLLIVKIFLIGHDSEISPVLSMPLLTETSPALAYA